MEVDEVQEDRKLRIARLEHEIAELESQRKLSQLARHSFMMTEIIASFWLPTFLALLALGVHVSASIFGFETPFKGVFAWLFFGFIFIITISWLLLLTMFFGRAIKMSAELSDKKAKLETEIAEEKAEQNS
ncbi:hypothetical protein [Photobacterium kasasachensis]|uniref:hypothetical protein n=1 Tax=Photobacterium kasasachensis TaxID=2910240 RepID=UPI003D13F6B2